MIHMRTFNELELLNQQFLVNLGVKFTLVQITETGLKKSILDATAPMRAYFKENGVHDYELQLQGTENRVFIPTTILTSGLECKTTTSLYRPKTKKGDPRLWIYKLTQYTQPDDIHAIIFFHNQLLVINTTRENIQRAFESPIINSIQEYLQVITTESTLVSQELLQHFRTASGQWFESEVYADTGIGRTIETLLGIQMNSSKEADYKGIEIKSARTGRPSSRKQLFCQVPNWELSKVKSSKEIVNLYGYYTENGQKTFQSTLTASHPVRDLQLFVNEKTELLEMQHIMAGCNDDVAVWKLIVLHKRLLTKHHETFWVNVENVVEEGKEYFRYDSILHTKNPNVGQFDVLLQQGYITLDMLLSRPSGHGDSYSFKLNKKGMPLLFPENSFYRI